VCVCVNGAGNEMSIPCGVNAFRWSQPNGRVWRRVRVGVLPRVMPGRRPSLQRNKASHVPCFGLFVPLTAEAD
jgi:hypothetical protein